MNTDASLYNLAATQGGVLRRDQALAAGLGRFQIDNRVKSGTWRPVSQSAYRLIDLDGSIELARAAVAVLPSAVASHFTAAQVHGMRFVTFSQVSVTVHARTTHRFPGVRVFRSRDLLDQHTEHWNGMPVTTVGRTVVDLASVVSDRRLAAIVDDLLAARRTTITELADVLNTVARKGRPGVRSMRSVLMHRSANVEQRTRLEALGLRLLTTARLGPFELEFPIPWRADRRYDVAFAAARLGIEWDSFRWHAQASTFQSDRERDREAIEHGWRILRFTWVDVTKRPETVVASVRAALAQSHDPSVG